MAYYDNAKEARHVKGGKYLIFLSNISVYCNIIITHNIIYL